MVSERGGGANKKQNKQTKKKHKKNSHTQKRHRIVIWY